MPCRARFMRAGATSHNAIAAKLNEHNVRTARGGGKFLPVRVGRSGKRVFGCYQQEGAPEYNTVQKDLCGFVHANASTLVDV